MITLIFPIGCQDDFEDARKSAENILPTLTKSDAFLFVVEKPELFAKVRNTMQEIFSDTQEFMATQFLVVGCPSGNWYEASLNSISRANKYVYVWNRELLHPHAIVELYNEYLVHTHAGLIQSYTDEWLGVENVYSPTSMRKAKRGVVDYASKDGGFLTKLEHFQNYQINPQKIGEFGLAMRKDGYQNYMIKNEKGE